MGTVSRTIAIVLDESAAEQSWHLYRISHLARIWESEGLTVVVQRPGDDPTPAVERLKAIRELYQTTKEFPVWPFDPANVRKFIGSYLAPLFIGFVIEFLVNLLRP